MNISLLHKLMSIVDKEIASEKELVKYLNHDSCDRLGELWGIKVSLRNEIVETVNNDDMIIIPLLEMFNHGEKIKAIRKYREYTGTSLNDSRNNLETLTITRT